VSYIVGRGADSLASISETKRIARNCQFFLQKNFGIDIPTQTEEKLTAHKFYLEQNYPNPFNPPTTINYIIHKQSNVTLKIFDVLGNEIALLVKKEQKPGEYSIQFHASELSGGIYFYQLQSDKRRMTRKMILLR
jgi:hypothetical protein